jgi:hypothetical protein
MIKKTPAKTPAKSAGKSSAKSDAAAVVEAPVRTTPIAYATGQIAAVLAQPFTRPPAFVPKKPRGS